MEGRGGIVPYRGCSLLAGGKMLRSTQVVRSTHKWLAVVAYKQLSYGQILSDNVITSIPAIT